MRTTRKLTAIVCILGAGSLVLAGPVGNAVTAPDGPTAVLHGSITRQNPAPAGGRIPVPGARIAALETLSGASYESDAAEKDGSYRIDGLPPGNYALAVRTDDGVYLSDGLVGLEAGQDRLVSFAVHTAAVLADEGMPSDEDEDGGEDDSGEGGETPSGGGAPTGTFWTNHPWLGGLTVLGSAFAVGAGVNQLTDDQTPIEKKSSKP